MKNIFERLQRLFQRSTDPDIGESDEQTNGSGSGYNSSLMMDVDAITSIMQLIEHTKEGEYSCEETLDLLDEYVELVIANQDFSALMPLVKGHVSDCPDCTERLEALIQILQSPQDSSII